MQTKLAGIVERILIILIICILTMGDVIAIAENLSVMTNLGEPAEELEIEEEIIELKQTLVTNREYKIGEEQKKILQLSLEINTSTLQTSSLKENKITLTTPIEGVIPEEIYVSEQSRVNFVNGIWEYTDDKLVINLQNDEIEKENTENIDKLVLTYVYDGSVDVSRISTTAIADGKLYNGKKAISEETIYEIENAEVIGEIVQINSMIQEIYKTELKKENQEFLEAIEIDLNYKNTEMMDKIILSDGTIEAYAGKNKEEVNVKYKQTLMSKDQVLQAIGENGALVIKNGKEELARIDKDTEANEEGYVYVNYEEISEITIEITLGEEDSAGIVTDGKFYIIHTKEMEKCDENINLDMQIRTMDVSLEKNEEISNFQVESVGEIKSKVTKAELGLDKQELTSSKENELVTTITLHTDDIKYDLNKNPKYQIVLPKEAQTVEVGEISILNNKNFKITENQVVENSNGQKVVMISLEGEQKEYTKTAGNVQIIVPIKVTTPRLMPTTKAAIELYYTNEKAESYTATEDYGADGKEINIITETDLIVATEAKIGEQEGVSYKTDIATLSMKKTEEAQVVEIKGTVINNTDTVKENLKVIGENELLGEITVNKGNVYYSETAEGPWGDTFSAGQKYFKIEIEKLEMGEKLEFTYNMPISETLEESKNYEAKYGIYEGDTLSKESKLLVAVEVEQKVEEPEIIEGEVEVSYESKVTKYGGYEIENVETDSQIVHEIYINNYKQEDKEIEIKITIPECINKTQLEASLHEKTDEIVFETGENYYKFLSYVSPVFEQDLAQYIITAPANTELMLYLELNVDKYVEKEVRTNINVFVDEEEIKFTDVKTAITPAIFEADIKAYINEKEIKTGEEIKLEKGEQIKYITTVVNNGETKEDIEISANNIVGFKRVKMEIYKNDELIKEYGESEADTFISSEIEMNGNDEIKIILVLELISDVTADRDIEEYTEINGYLDIIETDKIKLKLLKNVEEPVTPEEPDTPDEPVEEKYNISGIAWLDKDKDGEQDELEDYLTGIEVNLLNATTNEKIATVITDMDGKYKFKNLENGKYVVVFGYNTSTYNLTAYKKAGVAETKNSDGILTTQDGVNVAKTEIIEIANSNISNIDIGFTLKEIFDLEVTKQIKQITIKNNEGQTVYEYKNTNFAKIEIPSKYFKGTNLVIEYVVKIENKGDISGSVKTLTDHKPEGLEFASELNTSWYEGADGNLYCIELGADEIKPGETREISLVLTKEITDTKIQYITNEVELEDIFNEYLTTEKDLSNNKAEATLIVAIKTGAVRTYLGLWLACAIILSTGIYLIKNKVIVKK